MWVSAFVARATAFPPVGAGAPGRELAPPVRVEAAGKPIDIDVGHAAPWRTRPLSPTSRLRS
jgi:hypothetical protein